MVYNLQCTAGVKPLISVITFDMNRPLPICMTMSAFLSKTLEPTDVNLYDAVALARKYILKCCKGATM